MDSDGACCIMFFFLKHFFSDFISSIGVLYSLRVACITRKATGLNGAVSCGSEAGRPECCGQSSRICCCSLRPWLTTHSSSYTSRYLDCTSELFSESTLPFSHCLPSLAALLNSLLHPLVLLLCSAVHPVQSGLSGKQIYLLAPSVACWAHQEDSGPVSGVRSSTDALATLGPTALWPCPLAVPNTSLGVSLHTLCL